MKTKLSVVLALVIAGIFPAASLYAWHRSSNPPGGPESARDAIREVLNVTCGHILTSIAGENAPMELSTTEVGECEVADWEKAREAQNAYAFRLEDESVLFVVEVEGATP